MEVKSGYRKTEIGVLPEDWAVKPLGQLFTFKNGVNADKRAYGTGVRFVNVLEAITHSHLLCDDVLGRVKLPPSTRATYTVRRGDVLFNRTSETDSELALASTYVDSEDVVFGGFVIRGRPTSDDLDPVYSGYALRARALRAQIIPLGQGAVRANIGQENLSRVLAPVPSVAEQRLIAAALSDADSLLAGLDRLIAKKRDLKQAAMQQLLSGQTRLPGFQGEWEVKRIDQFAPLQRGFDLPTSSIRAGDHPVVYSNGIQNHHAQFMVKAPGVVTGRSGTIGNVHFVEQDFWPHNTSLWVTKFNGSDPKFVFYLLANIGLDRFGTGSGVPTLNRNDVHEFRVSVPTSKAEQVAIAAVLSDMDAELTTLEARRDKTRTLKQAMMQELLTGKTRLV